MITIQHSLITLYSKSENTNDFSKEVPYVLLPDAIRKYCGPRPYSHFEESPKKTSTRNPMVSYMHFPTNLKTVNKDNIKNERIYLAPGYKPCVLGEKTHIEQFEKTNGDLNPDYYAGVKKHLTQDCIFDDFIRKSIGLDCSRRFESLYPPEETNGKNVGIFTFNRPVKDADGKFQYDENGELVTEKETLDGNGVRKLIADIENHGVYILAYMIKKSQGITVNQDWFDRTVKPALDREYSEDLSNSTYNYMKIPEKINTWITEEGMLSDNLQGENTDKNFDAIWKHLDDGPIPKELYFEMYKQVALSMPAIDLERKEKEEKIQEGWSY